MGERDELLEARRGDVIRCELEQEVREHRDAGNAQPKGRLLAEHQGQLPRLAVPPAMKCACAKTTASATPAVHAICLPFTSYLRGDVMSRTIGPHGDVGEPTTESRGADVETSAADVEG